MTNEQYNKLIGEIENKKEKDGKGRRQIFDYYVLHTYNCAINNQLHCFLCINQLLHLPFLSSSS